MHDIATMPGHALQSSPFIHPAMLPNFRRSLDTTKKSSELVSAMDQWLEQRAPICITPLCRNYERGVVSTLDATLIRATPCNQDLGVTRKPGLTSAGVQRSPGREVLGGQP